MSEAVEVRRGCVYDAVLESTERAWGSEQAGFRPVVVVSRDTLNEAQDVAVVVPLTTYREGRRIYPSQVMFSPPEGGLGGESVALCEQLRAISKRRLRRFRGALSGETLSQLERALIVTLDLPAG